MQTDDTQSRLLKVAGGLMLFGFAFLAFVTQVFHPSHDENNHPVIFEKYAHDGHSGFEKPGGPAVQLLTIAFVIGVLVAGLRREARSAQPAVAA